MEKHFQIGPDFLQHRCAGNFHHTVQDREHPAGHTAQIGHVTVYGLSGNAVALYFKVTEQSSLLAGNSYQIDQRVYVFYKNGAQVAHKATFQIVVGRMASTQNQGPSIKNTALGVIAQIPHHGISSASVVCILQSVLADRDELALVVCGAAALGIPFHHTRPQQIFLSLAHTVNIAFKFLISVNGLTLGKILVTAYAGIVVLPSPLRG